MEAIILIVGTGIAIGMFIGYVLGCGDGREENRSQRIKDYKAGYFNAQFNIDPSGEEYLNEEK
jgi:hypothetical protein